MILASFSDLSLHVVILTAPTLTASAVTMNDWRFPYYPILCSINKHSVKAPPFLPCYFSFTSFINQQNYCPLFSVFFVDNLKKTFFRATLKDLNDCHWKQKCFMWSRFWHALRKSDYQGFVARGTRFSEKHNVPIATGDSNSQVRIG